ncbi:MAG: thioredoxin [Ruminococcaceae bacterium]|nr:thioredoxin [Oscillospiraceae bacterium]
MSVLNVTKDTFDAIVTQSTQPVLLDFWASWCGPCRMVSPVIDEIAEENPQITVGKVNVDEEPELAQAFGVMSIPTLVVIRNGQIVQRAVGVRPKEQILEMLAD